MMRKAHQARGTISLWRCRAELVQLGRHVNTGSGVFPARFTRELQTGTNSKAGNLSARTRRPGAYPHDAGVVAVATDIPPPVLRKHVIWLDIAQPAQALAWLEAYAHMRLPEQQLTGIL